MDSKTLVNNLRAVFSAAQTESSRYSRVWLIDEDFGGLYRNGMYVLNVKAGNKNASTIDEIHHVFALLKKHAREELKLIWRVAVFDADERIQYEFDDLVVLERNA